MERLPDTLERYLGLNPDDPTKYARRVANWRRLLKSRFGMSPVDFEKLLNIQNGLCAICKRPPKTVHGGRAFHIDHDDASKMVRGLLCYNCNSLLGHLRHDPVYLSAAVTYLMEPPAGGLDPRPRVRFDRRGGKLIRCDGSPPTRRTGVRPNRRAAV